MKQKPGYLGFIGDRKLPSYMGIIVNHYKDPYQATSIMESKRVCFVAPMTCDTKFHQMIQFHQSRLGCFISSVSIGLMEEIHRNPAFLHQ